MSPLFVAIVLHNKADVPTVLCVVHQFLCILFMAVSSKSLDTMVVYRQTRARGQQKSSLRSKTDLLLFHCGLLSLFTHREVFSTEDVPITTDCHSVKQ